jgi:transposase
MQQVKQKTADVYLGIDFHKNHCMLCGIDKDGKDVLAPTKIKTSLLVTYLSNRKGWKVGIEASGGVNHVVEVLKAQGHEVIIINPNQFRGIGIGGKKTDERDARALANGLRMGFVPEVYHRSRQARELKSLLTSREHIVQARVDAINHVRGTLREYGLSMPQGAEAFYAEARGKIEQLTNTQIRETLLLVFENIHRFRQQEKTIEEQMAIATANNVEIARLQTMPGVGPMTALAMLAVIDNIDRFENSKEFGSYLGLVPSVTASANKRMMGSITRSGSEMLRRYLIHGARAWMRYDAGSDPNRRWAEEIKRRRGMNKAVVALAHRMARMLYAMMKTQSVYKAKHVAAEEKPAA